MSGRFDVIIVGGSPAGLTVALLLAQKGYEVAVFERSDYDDFRPGEVLSPSAVAALRQAGFSETPPYDLAVQVPGTLSCWGTSQIDETDYLFSPLGMGWNVSRPRFDGWMAECVEKAGVKVLKRSAVGQIQRKADNWKVGVRRCGSIAAYQSEIVVLAAGRGSVRIAADSGKQKIDDRIVLLRYGTVMDQRLQNDARLLVEAEHKGWWYSAGLPGNGAVFGCVCDVADAPSKPQRNQYFLDRMRDAPITSARFQLCRFDADVLVAPASSRQQLPFAGAGWARVGQSAVTLDPLSGAGWASAINSAIKLVHTIDQAPVAFPDYSKWMSDVVDRYLAGRPAIYASALDRFRSAFWYRASTT